MHSQAFVEVLVSAVIAETESAVSVVIDVPEALKETFAYQSGQFLTLRIPVDGKYRHRCYSLSSAPGVDAKHKITIKRVESGLVSNYICSDVRAGNTLLVRPPAGAFVPASFNQDLLLFAGGSGVTPVLSILKTALASGGGKITFVYANRDEHSVIFRAELSALSRQYPARLTVIHWLETVQGLPTAEQLAALVGPFSDREVYICGPERFMAGVSAALTSIGVPGAKIHIEHFVSLPDEEAVETVPVGEQETEVTLEVLLDGVEHELVWPPGAKLLDVMLDAGLSAPYSCRVGGCSACMCRMLAGEVRMSSNLVLSEDDIARGWVLACQSHPLSPLVRVEIPS